jgi:hypothetical protein
LGYPTLIFGTPQQNDFDIPEFSCDITCDDSAKVFVYWDEVGMGGGGEEKSGDRVIGKPERTSPLITLMTLRRRMRIR